MSEPSRATLRKIQRAARLRVEGNPWEVVAAHIGRRHADSAKHLTQEHPQEWAAAFAQAREKHLGGLEMEAVRTLREMLSLHESPRAANMEPMQVEQIREAAAHSLLCHCAKMRAQRVVVNANATVNDDSAGMDWREVRRLMREDIQRERVDALRRPTRPAEGVA